MRLLPAAAAPRLPFKKAPFTGNFRKKIVGGLLFLLTATAGFAQSDTTINQCDKTGKPHGFWYQKHPERMGEPAYTEFGTYEHGRKYGVWHILSNQGDLMAAQRYKNNALDGESRYYEAGRLATVGHYRGLNPDQPYDTIWVTDPISGNEKKVVISTERGATRHGTWRYYDLQTGQPTLEEEYQVDDLIGSRYLGVPKDDSAAYRQRVGKLPHNSSLPPARSNATRLIER